MARAFLALGCDVRIAYIPKEGEGRVRRVHDLPEAIELLPLPRRVLPLHKRFWPRPGGRAALTHIHARLWSRRAMGRLLDAGAVDVVLVREPLLALDAVRRGAPVILEVHGMPEGAAACDLLRRAATQPTVATFAVTDLLRADLLEAGAVDERCLVAHDAVDLRAFGDTSGRADARRLLDLAPDRLLAGYCGSRHSNRGLDVLLEAAVLLDDIDVLVVGPELGSDLPANVRAVGNVRHHLVGPYLTACDVLVLPGRSEDHYARHSSPLKLFEYMASGRPIVASDLPGLREIVTHDETAWLVTPDDPAALAAGIRQVLSRPDGGASLGTRGRLAVASRTWTSRARALLVAVGLEPPGATAGASPP